MYSVLTAGGSSVRGSDADCKLCLTIVRPNLLSTPETLANWTDGRVSCRHSAPISFLVHTWLVMLYEFCSHINRLSAAATSQLWLQGKGKRYLIIWYSAAPRWTHAQERFTISEVAADWHELTIPQRIMRPSIARASEQLDPRCSMQAYHRPNQL